MYSSSSTKVPRFMDLIISPKTLRKTKIRTAKFATTRVQVYQSTCSPDPLYRSFVRRSEKVVLKENDRQAKDRCLFRVTEETRRRWQGIEPANMLVGKQGKRPLRRLWQRWEFYTTTDPR